MRFQLVIVLSCLLASGGSSEPSATAEFVSPLLPDVELKVPLIESEDTGICRPEDVWASMKLEGQEKCPAPPPRDPWFIQQTGKVVEVTDEELQLVINSAKAASTQLIHMVLVKLSLVLRSFEISHRLSPHTSQFYWGGKNYYSERILPAFDRLAAIYPELTFLRIDAHKYPSFNYKLSIWGLPLAFAILRGEPVRSFIRDYDLL